MYETSASPGSIHDTGCVGLVHWDDPEVMPSGHFTMDQMYGLKINDLQLFFPQAYGT